MQTVGNNIYAGAIQEDNFVGDQCIFIRKHVSFCIWSFEGKH